MLIEPTIRYLLHRSVLRSFMARIIICSAALGYYVQLQKQQSMQHSIAPPAPLYRLTIGTILAQLMMTFALTLLSSIKEALWHPSVQPILHFSSNIDFVYRGIVEISCLTAILEELLFRGILEKLLSKITSSRRWITVISAIAFSLMHCNMSNNLLYFVMGCFLSYLYHQTNHIIYPMLAHGLHNLCATSIIYLALDKRLDVAINNLPIVTRGLLAIGTLLAVYTYVTHMFVSQKTKKSTKQRCD